MDRLKQDAIAKGATASEFQGDIPQDGYFWPPTILTDLSQDADILTEEQFGPLIPVIPFEGVDQAIELANRSNYGLASYLFTDSSDTVRAVVDRLAVGSIMINELRGVRADVINPGIKNSGYGYEGGDEGFRAFQTLKLVGGTTIFQDS